MKKNVKKVLALTAAMLILCANFEALATSVPKKTESAGTQEKYSSDTQKVISTVTENETKTEKEEVKEETKTTVKSEKEETQQASTKEESTEKEESSATASPKATEKTTKATAKATQKTKSTEKATQKASATEKATQKTTSSSSNSSKSTVATIKPEIEDEEETTTKKVSATQALDETEAEDNVIVVEDPEPTLNVVTNPEQINGKKYLTKGGAFGMFILTVLVSAVLSFLISYRFYKMNRTDSHVMAEIRALKRDIDTKMAGTVGGFSEYETKTTNSNPSYARSGQPIRRNVENKQEAPATDMYSKWESQINTGTRETLKEELPSRRTEHKNTRSARYSRTREQKSTVEKIKSTFDDLFSKKK